MTWKSAPGNKEESEVTTHYQFNTQKRPGQSQNRRTRNYVILLKVSKADDVPLSDKPRKSGWDMFQLQLGSTHLMLFQILNLLLIALHYLSTHTYKCNKITFICIQHMKTSMPSFVPINGCLWEE